MHRCYRFCQAGSDVFIQFSLLFNESRAGLKKLCVPFDHLQHSLMLLSHLGLNRTNKNNNKKINPKVKFFIFR